MIYSAANSRTLFTGAFAGAEAQGPKATVRFSAFGAKLRSEHPALRLASTCNVRVFSGPCGLDIADNIFTAEFRSSSGLNRWNVLITAHGSGSIPSVPADFLAGGAIRWESGGRTMLATITANTEKNGADRLTITLDRDPGEALTVGDELTFWMGCPGTLAACVARENEANFRGFPFLPVANPANAARPKTNSASGKK